MTQKNAGMGFNADVKKKKKNSPIDLSLIYTQNFMNLIPGDVAIATEEALKSLGMEFEEISTFKSLGPFGTGEPTEVPFVRTQIEGGIEIPYGTYRVKGLGDIGMNLGGNRVPSIMLTGILESKDAKGKWNELMSKIKELASKNSIFKGKAVQASSPNDLLIPQPMDLTEDHTVIFNRDIEELLQTCVIWPIANRQAAAEIGIRTKRGALLDGFYGCGKSLFLYNAAKVAKQSGWTVLSMDPGMIQAGVSLAPMLEPVCLIVEDVDAGAHGNRDYLNGLLNSLSSVVTKCNKDMILLVSTNFMKRIDPALLRPERIDAIIRVPLPDREARERLIRQFAGNRLSASVDMDAVCASIEGYTPAIIGEVVERSLIDSQRDGSLMVNSDHLLFHAKGMQLQQELAVPEFRKDSAADRLAESLHNVVNGDE